MPPSATERLVATLREPLLRLIRVIDAEPPCDDFPAAWALAIEDAKSLPLTLAVARKLVP